MKTYQRTPSELFAELEKAEDKVKLLQENLTLGVSTVLQMAFNPKIVLGLPEGDPPYKADTNPPDLTRSRFDNAIKQIGVCTLASKIPSYKKEQIFISILESICDKDAKIVIAAKDKKLTELYPFITEELVKKSAPELLK